MIFFFFFFPSEEFCIFLGLIIDPVCCKVNTAFLSFSHEMEMMLRD